MPAQRHSKKRDAILECLRAAHTHPSAEWIYGQLKPLYPDLSLGTVYRNLAAFKQEGIINSVGVVGGSERFDGECRPHAHFICSSCGAVMDVEGCSIPEEITKSVNCGDVLESSVTFTGICINCAAKRTQE